MTDYPPLRTTLSGLTALPTPYRLEKQPRWADVSPGQVLGPLQVTKMEKYPWVETVCVLCRSAGRVAVNNLQKRVRPWCAQCPKELMTLSRRFQDRKQACQSDHPNYGGRGIQFNFSSTAAAAVWMWWQNGIYLGQDLDRIDNEGHYEPGNVRWATRGENMRNARSSKLRSWDQKYWPYGEGQVRQLLAQGMNRQDIMQHARDVVAQRGPWWKTVEKRLQSMTYSMPENVIVSPPQDD